MLRDAAISVSLANLCFIKVWGKALSGAGAYFTEFKVAYAAIMLDVLILSLLFLAGISIARRFQKPLVLKAARWAFLGALLTAINGIVVLLGTLSGMSLATSLGRTPAYAVGLLGTVALVVAGIHARRQLLSLAPRVLLILLPFAPITFSQAIYKFLQDIGTVEAATTSSSTEIPHQNPTSRVVWIIFDEMDQRLTFNQRPSSIELPELDHFRSQAVYATNAYPPAPLTYMSMPALITGRLVAKVTPLRADELMVKFDGEGDAVGWSKEPNVFSRARGNGFNTALAGWCHPYCEVIGANLTKCEDVKEKSNTEINLTASMFSQAEGLISTVPLTTQATIPLVQRVGFVNRLVTTTERKKYTARYKRVLESSLKAAADPNLDLVFVHSPVPHPPGIYDSVKNEFSLASKNGYVDNLELVDRTVGEIRKAMEKAGLWEQTTVIISADHWWRSEMWSRGPFWTPEDISVAGERMDHRIPFLVKLSNQNTQTTYDAEFNTVVTQNLVLAIMNGELKNATDVTSWLDRNRSISDSPYNKDELLP